VGNEVYTVGVEVVDAPPLTTPTISPTMAPPPAKPVEKKALPPPSVEVKADDIVVILEAMKMANALSTPISGRVKAINFKSGERVARDDVLAVIG